MTGWTWQVLRVEAAYSTASRELRACVVLASEQTARQRYAGIVAARLLNAMLCHVLLQLKQSNEPK